MGWVIGIIAIWLLGMVVAWGVVYEGSERREGIDLDEQ